MFNTVSNCFVSKKKQFCNIQCVCVFFFSIFLQTKMNFSACSDYCGDARVIQHTVITHNKRKLTFSPEDTVLDAGCGTGEDTKLTALKVGKVTGQLRVLLYGKHYKRLQI